MNEVDERLKEIKIEEYIWIIYLAIIFLSYYSNSLEKDYFLNKNNKSKDEYRLIMIIIFSILVFVYLYFFIDSYNSFKNIDSYSKEKKEKSFLSFLASTFILTSGIIYLYLAYKDKDLDVELAFN